MGCPGSARSGAAASVDVGPKPEIRLKIYVPQAARSEAERIGLPNSPSFGISIPVFNCSVSTADPGSGSRAGSSASSAPARVGFAQASRSLSGRGRLPACVVRIWSVLRLIFFPPFFRTLSFDTLSRIVVVKLGRDELSRRGAVLLPAQRCADRVMFRVGGNRCLIFRPDIV